MKLQVWSFEAATFMALLYGVTFVVPCVSKMLWPVSGHVSLPVGSDGGWHRLLAMAMARQARLDSRMMLIIDVWLCGELNCVVGVWGLGFGVWGLGFGEIGRAHV